VKSAAAEVIAMYGESMLPKVAKMHFKTAAEVLVSASKE
jgi:ribonuclease HIII